MSEKDLESQILSEDRGESSEKVVPVAEAIRYRKRAQAAETQLATIEEELAETRRSNENLIRQLDEIRLEQQLASGLIAADVADLETAILVAKAKLKENNKGDVNSVIEHIRKEKSYLFRGTSSPVVISRTAGVRDKNAGGKGVLERFAQKACASGNRKDMQEYLKLKRNFV